MRSMFAVLAAHQSDPDRHVATLALAQADLGSRIAQNDLLLQQHWPTA